VLDTGLNTEEASLVTRLTGPGGDFEVLINRDNVLLAHRVRTGAAPPAPSG